MLLGRGWGDTGRKGGLVSKPGGRVLRTPRVLGVQPWDTLTCSGPGLLFPSCQEEPPRAWLGTQLPLPPPPRTCQHKQACAHDFAFSIFFPPPALANDADRRQPTGPKERGGGLPLVPWLPRSLLQPEPAQPQKLEGAVQF